VYTALELQLAYAKDPVSTSVTAMLPGGQEDGFKQYGMNLSIRFQYAFAFNLELWGSVEFHGIGSDIAVLPALGTKYYIPLMNYLDPQNTAGSAGVSERAENAGSGSTAEEADAAPPRWYLGLSGGYANNALHTSTGGRALTEYKNGHGFTIGLPARYQFAPWFAIQAELQYVQKNYTWRRTGQFDRVYSKVTNSFIEIPLMASFPWAGKSSGSSSMPGAMGAFG
jgi:hypothetical protein